MKRAWAGDPKYVVHFRSLPTLPVESRKAVAELVKENLALEDFKDLMANVSSPRWPQYFGYLQALQFPPHSVFSNLGK